MAEPVLSGASGDAIAFHPLRLPVPRHTDGLRDLPGMAHKFVPAHEAFAVSEPPQACLTPALKQAEPDQHADDQPDHPVLGTSWVRTSSELQHKGENINLPDERRCSN
jgi:hypothetical protein